jgi:hypothetical protein
MEYRGGLYLDRQGSSKRIGTAETGDFVIVIDDNPEKTSLVEILHPTIGTGFAFRFNIVNA